jgi:ribosomal protein L7/L12
MNNLKPDTFVLMVAAMSEKMVELENGRVDLLTHISQDHAEMDRMQETITDLRRQAEDKCDELSDLRLQVQNLRDTTDRQRFALGDVAYLRTQNVELQARVQKLESENYKLKYDGKTPEEVALQYMVLEGGKVWADGQKITCIKEVRACTQWGLKEAKDWCEANGSKFAPEPNVEEKGPNTRPSQGQVRKTG